jgi:hypothetical protein
MRLLFDHLVGAGEDQRREGEPERFRSLEVDDQLEPGGLLDGQIGGLSPLRIRSNSASSPSGSEVPIVFFLGVVIADYRLTN